ncbi:MAG: hypothetical protein IJX76_02215 [Clostridia bacterium]|nr:hypothetical protein [Clostridia bacterium]
MRKNARKTRVLALSSLFVALSVVILYLGCFLEVLDLTVAAVASLLVLLAVIEMGKGTAAMVWLATSILAFLLLPNKFIAVEYAFLMGCYPLVKALAERLPRVISWVVKLVFVNIALAVMVVLGHFVFAYPIESVWLLVGTFVLATVTGVVFDIALTRLLTLYLMRLRSALRIERLLK